MRGRPQASAVLRSYLKQKRYPHWTSFFVRYSDVRDDNHGRSHFNFSAADCNYEILRTGCYPFIKYHCTRTEPGNDLRWSDRLITGLKFSQGFLPCLVYGVYAWFLISHFEVVEEFEVRLYYLYKEEENSRY